MVAHDLIGFLKRHSQGGGFSLGRRTKPAHGKLIRLNAPCSLHKRFQPRRRRRTRRHFFHQRLGKGQNDSHCLVLVRPQCRDVLIQLPQHAMKRQLAILDQNLLDLAHLNRLLRRVRGQQKRCRRSKHIKRDQGLRRQQFGKPRLAVLRQRPLQIRSLEILQRSTIRKLIRHSQGNRNRAAQALQHMRLNR